MLSYRDSLDSLTFNWKFVHDPGRKREQERSYGLKSLGFS